MTRTSYDSLLTALRAAIRSADQGGNTSAADVRGFLTALLDQLLADAPAAPAFVPIAQNQYGTHPAFSDQATLNAWLLGYGSSVSGNAWLLADSFSTTRFASYSTYGYGASGYSGINAYLLAPPTLTALSAASAYAGDILLVQGKNLTPDVLVCFGPARSYANTAPLFNVNAAGTMAAVQLPYRSGGKFTPDSNGDTVIESLVLTAADGSYLVQTGLHGFTLRQPIVTGCSPTSGPAGTLVTLTGYGLRGVQALALGRADTGSNGPNSTPVQHVAGSEGTTITARIPGSPGSIDPVGCYLLFDPSDLRGIATSYRGFTVTK